MWEASLCIWVGNTCTTNNKKTRKMGEIRENIGMKKPLRKKVVGSRLQWAGHIQGMSEERLKKRAWKTEEGGRRKKGRSKL